MKKKVFLLMLLAALSLIHGAAQEYVRMPQALKSGDTIAIISPSSTPTREVVERGCAVLRGWGYVPVVGKHVFSSYHGFAGTAEERAADLLWALRDSTIKAIMCSRGGDGAVQVLQRIPLKEFASHPKWLIGFSDATALHSGMVSAGVMSIHGTMCEGIAARSDDDPVILAMRQILQGQMPVYSAAHHRLDQTGEATGILVGGNMSVFCGLAGSDYDFLNRADEGLRVGEPSSGMGLILFIEDTGEGMSKVDRMLHQIEIRGVLPRLKGIVVGHFSKYKEGECGFETMYDMLHEYLKDYDVPVCYDFPIGHHSGKNYPLVEGCRVRLKVTADGTQLDFR